MRILGTGNVGIGEEAPLNRLHLNNGGIAITGGSAIGTGDYGNRLLIDTSTSTDHDYILCQNTTNGTAFIVSNDTTNGPRVGIGTATPQSLLDVEGAIQVGHDDYLTDTSIPLADSICRMYIKNTDSTLGIGNDCMIFEKTDGGSSPPDSGFAFVTIGNDSKFKVPLLLRVGGDQGAIFSTSYVALSGSAPGEGGELQLRGSYDEPSRWWHLDNFQEVGASSSTDFRVFHTNNGISGVSKLVITEDGNVGIGDDMYGDAGATEKLEITSGNIQLTSATQNNGMLIFNNTSSTAGYQDRGQAGGEGATDLIRVYDSSSGGSLRASMRRTCGDGGISLGCDDGLILGAGEMRSTLETWIGNDDTYTHSGHPDGTFYWPKPANTGGLTNEVVHIGGEGGVNIYSANNNFGMGGMPTNVDHWMFWSGTSTNTTTQPGSAGRLEFVASGHTAGKSTSISSPATRDKTCMKLFNNGTITSMGHMAVADAANNAVYSIPGKGIDINGDAAALGAGSWATDSTSFNNFVWRSTTDDGARWNEVCESASYEDVMRLYGNYGTSGGNSWFGDLHVKGDVIAVSSAFSDKRLKTDINSLDSKECLSLVQDLQGVEFKWNFDNPGKPGRQIGLIAQDVEKVVPEVVDEKNKLGEDDDILYKRVEYDKLIPLLIESIKEQQSQIEELQQKVMELS